MIRMLSHSIAIGSLVVLFAFGGISSAWAHCCDQAALNAQEHPCHEEENDPPLSPDHHCCVDTFCAKCFQPCTGADAALSVAVPMRHTDAFGFYNEHVRQSVPTGLERPPKFLS